MKLYSCWIVRLTVAGVLLLTQMRAAHGSVYVSSITNDIADAFVTSGSGNNANPSDNYGAAGALVVAGSASANGEFLSLVEFNLSAAKTAFDTQYGVGNWTVSSVRITLKSNFGIQGEQPSNLIFPSINTGGFSITWMTNNSWSEGTGTPSVPSVYPSSSGSLASDITFNNLTNFESGSDEALGSFQYTPPGNNTNTPVNWSLNTGVSASGFTSAIAAGQNISLLFSPTDTTVSYLFDSRTQSSYGPIFTITAVPEPGVASLILAGVVSLVVFSRRKSH